MRAYYVDRDCKAAARYSVPAGGSLNNCVLMHENASERFHVVSRSGRRVRQCLVGTGDGPCFSFQLVSKRPAGMDTQWGDGQLVLRMGRHQDSWKVVLSEFNGGGCLGSAKVCESRASAWKRRIPFRDDEAPLLQTT
jgi:hypothetical protein